MSVGGRVRDRLAEIGMSQSELARRVSVNQSTIAGLIAGRSRSSAHLHRIARELATTPAYLTGETDDVAEGAPPPPAPLRHQQVMLPVTLPSEAALAAAFQGVLRASKSMGEDASLLVSSPGVCPQSFGSLRTRSSSPRRLPKMIFPSLTCLLLTLVAYGGEHSAHDLAPLTPVPARRRAPDHTAAHVDSLSCSFFVLCHGADPNGSPVSRFGFNCRPAFCGLRAGDGSRRRCCSAFN